MQFAKVDVPEEYMSTNDEELLAKIEQVISVAATHSAEKRNVYTWKIERHA